ncbi:MAG: EAL domain-containing protein [Acidimicrobiia bacterium]
MAATYFVLPGGSLPAALVFLALNVFELGALVVVWRRSPRIALWYPILLFSLAFLLASAGWFLYPRIAGRPLPFPSPVDGLYILASVFAAAFLIGVIRRQGGDSGSVLDALVVAAGLGVLSWEFLMEPIVTRPGLSLAVRLVSLAYPATDLVLFGLAVRLALVGARRRPAHWFLLAWVACQLVADSAYVLTLNNGSFHLHHPLFAGWLLSFVFLAAATLHPSMRKVLEKPATTSPPGQVWRRLVGMGAAALLAPVIVVTDPSRNAHGEVRALAILSAAIFLLVLVRLGLVMAQERALRERLRHDAFFDSLTGLANRALFADRMSHALARARRSGATTAVLFLDLDNFKRVNDSIDHQAGDALLVAVAARLRAVIRDGDTVARLGGDEFTVLCEDIESPSQALTVGSRIQEALAAPFRVAGREMFVSASIGVAVADAGAEDAHAVLRDADAAMYRAKLNGRSRIESFDASMRQESARQLQVAAELHHALQRGELRLFYQPLLRLRDGDVVGTEALLRWQHPTRGLLGPAEFIPLAEETGLIVPIGAWVLEEACRAAARWPAPSSGAQLKVSVNISARQLRDDALVDVVASALVRSGLPPSALCLEITESLLMVDAERSSLVLGRLKDLGVSLAVDDFGTGYSSLSRLKHFPLDYLKVDRSFVDGLGTDADDKAIVCSTIALTHALGMAVVAEGVETETQLAVLRNLGCESAQGYLWSPPLPEVELHAWLSSRREAMAALKTLPAPPLRARVLVVDDNPGDVELVRVLLGASGHEVIPLTDPARFVDTIYQQQPDLVLMDLRMPGRTGLELIQDLPDGSGRPPVVAITGHADWLSPALADADRFAGVIAKPIEPETFAQQVEGYLTLQAT